MRPLNPTRLDIGQMFICSGLHNFNIAFYGHALNEYGVGVFDGLVLATDQQASIVASAEYVEHCLDALTPELARKIITLSAEKIALLAIHETIIEQVHRRFLKSNL